MTGSPLLRLVRYARPYLALLLLAVAFGTLHAGARMGRAYLTKPLLDDVILAPSEASQADPGFAPPAPGRLLSEVLPSTLRASRPGEVDMDVARPIGERFWGLMLVGLLVVLVLPIAHFGKDYLTEYAMGRVLIDVQQDLCTKLLSLPLRFHQRIRRGDVLTRGLNDALRAHQSLRVLAGDVLQAAITAAVAIATLVFISWQLSLVAFCLAPVLVGVVATFGRRIRRTARRRQEKMSDVTQRLVEILSGIKVIQAFRAEGHEEEGFRRENRRLFRRGMKVVKNRVTSRSVVEGVQQLFGLAILGFGAVLVLRRQWGLQPGDLVAFATVMFANQRTIKALTKGWTQLQDLLPSADRFFELIDTTPVAPDPPAAVRLSGVREGIRISKVHFSYGREPVLRDVSADIRAGEVVAIVGRTGAGKTTLADLLLRFHDPDSGSIEIDGIDLRRIARDSLLERVAVVTQEPFLFDGTIRDNVRYGRPEASDTELRAAARAAHVDEFVDALPEGWNTAVGDAGNLLSGGQRQRITIARALAKNPDILIFDEATSSLDAKSERLVQDAIDNLLRGRTVLLIAHRLSTIRRADRVLVLEDGVVSQIGTHDELVERPGLYRELVGLQTG